jgi:limonene-1,2-epoxide hydrolase
MNPIELVKDFINKISTQDVQGLAGLMTEDHLFIDGMGTQVRGRENMITGWEGYYQMVPDYRIRAERFFHDRNIVAVFGFAGGTYSKDGRLKPENRWEVPAAWLAEVKDHKIAVWQVFADNEPVRQIIEREEKG